MKRTSVRPRKQVDDALHPLAHLELGHIYCQQADYPQAQYHYEYAAHRGGGGTVCGGIDPMVPKFAPTPGNRFNDDARLMLALCYRIGRVGRVADRRQTPHALYHTSKVSWDGD